MPALRLIVAVAIGVLLAGALLSGCARRAPDVQPDDVRIVWPPPPDPPRIEYEGTFSNPRELGIRGGWLRRAVSRLARGRRLHGMARPYSVASGPSGVLAVADPDARSVHVYDPQRKRYERIVRSADGPLVSPMGVAFDDKGGLFVSDSVRAAIYRFDARGKPNGTVGGRDQLLRPTGLAYDERRGVLYVVDTLAHQVVGYDRDGGRVFRAGGRGTADGLFNYPVAVALDAEGRLWITDTMNFRVQLFDASGRFLRAFGRQGRGPGDFDKVKGVAVDPDGHVWIVEGLHDVIHVYDDRGTLLTVIGASGSRPGQFLLPAGIHIDAAGRVLVADSANRRVQILRYLDSPSPTGGMP
jgi:sugar lactone lactonase YvrE